MKVNKLNKNNMKCLLFLLFSFTPLALEAQDILQQYIAEGIENNLALKQRESGYSQSLAALREAHGLYYPSVSINARYTVSEGGRVIDFPVGDLLNPVYTTLNQLTASSLFPMVENQQIAFLRPTEQETKIRLVQPVLNTDLIYNAKIKKELVSTEGIGVEQYKRELVAEISKAWYAVGMTRSLVKMLEDTRPLLLENVRVSTRLFESSKVTKDNVYRARAELSRFDQQVQAALKNRQAATAYFNFLLNRPLTDSVISEQPRIADLPSGMTEDYARQALTNREELITLEKYRDIADLSLHMKRSAALPDLFVVADYGFQGEKYRFNKNQDYMQASLVLSWDLFGGLQNRARIQQARIQREILDRKVEEARSQVNLQVINAVNALKTSRASADAAQAQVESAREAFRLVSRKYDEGQASLIEFIDARTTMTQAEENLIITRFSYLSDLADFEKIVSMKMNP
jgi:outer membrane protein